MVLVRLRFAKMHLAVVARLLNVAQCSVRLFVQVESFKDYLVVEIEAFICEIFLRVLESPTAAFVQKRLVLEAFRKLCQDRNTLVEIFLNYDVTLDASGMAFGAREFAVWVSHCACTHTFCTITTFAA